MSGRFALALSCIDGRAWPAVAEWMERTYHAVFVDLVTAPGMATWVAEGGEDPVREAALVSVRNHDAVAVAVAAHADCAASPVDEATHREHVRQAMEKVKQWDLGVPIVGLYVDGNRKARKVHEIPA